MNAPKPFHNLNYQAAFDTMLAHLRKQRFPALADSGFCRYRTGTGLKCAVGALIPDEFYEPDFDCGMGPYAVVERLGGSDTTAEFLRDAQLIMHDQPAQGKLGDYLPSVETGAREIARRYCLHYAPAAAVENV